ncbi:hypothetical protein AVEN_68343-1 [Araneus ventricosus]|uniref:Uncharacterized protein n=1 Tax=Araneus ventricosus TaxID=182803 RepID=A0A4Y2IRT6_ARAVE|nr:hypothetical protein AVEN_68343-1 [Araneus ventricosus]
MKLSTPSSISSRIKSSLFPSIKYSTNYFPGAEELPPQHTLQLQYPIDRARLQNGSGNIGKGSLEFVSEQTGSKKKQCQLIYIVLHSPEMFCAISHCVSTFGQSVHYLSSYFLKYIAITEEALKKRIHPLQPADLKYLDNIDDPAMSIEEKLQSLALPEEQRWMEAERTAFITRKIQGIVQAFQYRAEKAKEKLVQPPTPSPSPPLESSSENDPCSPIHQSRPRLQSLIEEEKSSIDSWSQTISFFCCSIRKKLLPTFPTIIDPAEFSPALNLNCGASCCACEVKPVVRKSEPACMLEP